MAFKRMTDLDMRGKRVLIRSDLNVPLADGKVTSDARIRASLPTYKLALEAGASVMVMSHLGRPSEGVFDSKFSLAPVAAHLSELLGREVPLVREWLDGATMSAGQLVLCENVRFNSGEKADDADLSARMAKLCDIFVMDAFGTAHRAQASTHGIIEAAAVACAGPLLAAELDALATALAAPKRPLAALVGGSKVSTKLEVLESLIAQVDQLVVGGGIANTFLAACGHRVGKSLYEPQLVEVAARLIAQAGEHGSEIPIPTDVVVAKELSNDAAARVVAVDEVEDDEMILDIGPATAQALAAKLCAAKTIVWNGPVGAFEFAPFSGGTQTIARAIAASDAFSLAGGGDTLAAIDAYGLSSGISYISTGGGAFLEFLEGKTLPAVAALERRA